MDVLDLQVRICGMASNDGKLGAYRPCWRSRSLPSKRIESCGITIAPIGTDILGGPFSTSLAEDTLASRRGGREASSSLQRLVTHASGSLLNLLAIIIAHRSQMRSQDTRCAAGASTDAFTVSV